ncbi:MAG: response regulator, partial [Lentisphaeria bacterium]
MSHKYKILIVDDEKNTRDGLSQLLQFDYLVECAENGEIALKMIKKSHYDIVLTDLNMPIIDGLELTRAVKSLDNAPLIIILTAYGSLETTINAMKAGAYDYITKPVNIDQLELMIKRGIQQQYGAKESEKIAAKDTDIMMI